MRYILSFALLLSLISCKQEQETPKVSYEENKSSQSTTPKDSS